MQNVKVDESQTEIKISRRNINNFRYADESQFLGRLIKSPGVPKERGVWNSQGGKDKLFFFFWSTFLQFSSVQLLSRVQLLSLSQLHNSV